MNLLPDENPEFEAMLDVVRGRIKVIETTAQIHSEEHGVMFPGLAKELETFKRILKTLEAIRPHQESFRNWVKKNRRSGR